MKTVYFVRHASTEGNETGAWQLATAPISPKGREQAKAVAQRFSSIDIDTIISSEMQRALDTAQYISEVTGRPVVPSPLFHEILKPSAIRGKSKTDPEAFAIWRRISDDFACGNTLKYSDEENFFDCRARAIAAVSFLEEHPDQNICVLTHGVFLRIVMAVLMNGREVTPQESAAVFDFLRTTNTAITKCTFDENRWLLRTWNDDAHMGIIQEADSA